MNRRRQWEKAQETPQGAKEFLTKLTNEEPEWVKTGYSDGNYTRKLIEETLAETEDPELRAVLLECSRLCPPADPFADLALDLDAEKKVYPIYWEPGEIVKFGRYPQGANGEVKPIEWIVLDADYAGTGKDTRLLLSRYGLDAKPYNEEWEDVTWETCTLRSWLNGEFLERAFTEEERKKLALTHVENPDGIGGLLDEDDYDEDDEDEYDDDGNRVAWRTPGGHATDDRVFLLSLDEVEKEKYFEDDDERVCYPTQTAKDNGAYTEDSEGACWWRLRSPGYYPNYAVCVDYGGYVGSRGYGVDTGHYCVRPVVCARLF